MLRKTLLLDCEKADVQLKELDQVQVMLQVEPKGVFHEVIILPASMTTENDGHSSFLEKFWSFTHCNLLGSSILSEWFAFRYNHELICLTAHSRNAALNEVDHWKLSVIIGIYQGSFTGFRKHSVPGVLLQQSQFKGNIFLQIAKFWAQEKVVWRGWGGEGHPSLTLLQIQGNIPFPPPPIEGNSPLP